MLGSSKHMFNEKPGLQVLAHIHIINFAKPVQTNSNIHEESQRGLILKTFRAL